MSLPKLKTAVLVVDLIAAIERIRDAELKAAQEEMKAYPKKRAAYLAAVRKHLRGKAAAITPDWSVPQETASRYSKVTLQDWLHQGFPKAPDQPSDRCIASKYDRLIAQLRLTTEPKVRLSPEDFHKFMRGDSSACCTGVS